MVTNDSCVPPFVWPWLVRQKHRRGADETKAHTGQGDLNCHGVTTLCTERVSALVCPVCTRQHVPQYHEHYYILPAQISLPLCLDFYS